MASETWFGQLETNVFNKFKKLMQAHNNSKVNGANYTSSGVDTSDLSLPTVYLHELAGVEQGMTLTNTSVNAMLCNIQIDVYAGSKSDCALITRVALSMMKSMRFNAVAMPVITNIDTDVIHSITRFRRVVGASDIESGLIT